VEHKDPTKSPAECALKHQSKATAEKGSYGGGGGGLEIRQKIKVWQNMAGEVGHLHQGELVKTRAMIEGGGDRGCQ